MSVIDPIRLPDLVCEAQDGPEMLELRISGNCDLPVAPRLTSFLQQVLASIESSAVTTVVIDLRALEFLNAACLRAMVTWVDLVRPVATSRAIQLRFVSSPARPWQRRSLNALRAFAVDLITVVSD